MTPNALADFRATLPDCELAVFADIASRTVLGSDGALRYPQEYLDALCVCAAELFDQKGNFSGHPVEHVLFLSPTGGRAFFRATSEPAEALCCICAPEVDVPNLIAAGRAAFGSPP